MEPGHGWGEAQRALDVAGRREEHVCACMHL